VSRSSFPALIRQAGARTSKPTPKAKCSIFKPEVDPPDPTPRPTVHSGRPAPDADRKPRLRHHLARLPAFRTGFRSRATLESGLPSPPASVSSEPYRRPRLSNARSNSTYASGLMRASKSDLRSANALGWTHLGMARRVRSSSTKCSKKATAAAFCRSRDDVPRHQCANP